MHKSVLWHVVGRTGGVALSHPEEGAVFSMHRGLGRLTYSMSENWKLCS